MGSKRRFLFVFLLFSLVAIACRLSGATPVAWVGTPTAQSEEKTLTAQALSFTPTAKPATATPSTQVPTSAAETATAQTSGPWLIFPSEDGLSLYSVDQNTNQMRIIDLPPLVNASDLVGGLAPDGSSLLVRAGRVEVPDELAIYQLRSPETPPAKITPLLGPALQNAIAEQKSKLAPYALKAVTQPNGISWRSDSQMAVFTAALQGSYGNLYTWQPASGQIDRLTNRTQQDFSPIWSHGGGEILFESSNTNSLPPVWQVDRVVGLYTNDRGMIYEMYAPPADSLGEVFASWDNNNRMLSYTQSAVGNRNLKLIIIRGGEPKVIWPGVFTEMAFDPTHNLAAVLLDSVAASKLNKTAGVYFSSDNINQFHLAQIGDFQHLEYSDTKALFIASGKNGTIVFGPDGVVLSLRLEERASYSPNGKWLVGWGQSGARLYTGEGLYLQDLSDAPVENLIWQNDSAGFFILTEEGLQHYQFPLLQATLISQDVARGHENWFGWLGPR